MNILPFGFPIGNGAGFGAATTPQLPPSGLGFAVALDGALGDGAGIANGAFGFPVAGGSAAQIDGMPVLDLAAGTPASEATAGILPPAVPMAQLLTTAARISTPAAPAAEVLTEGAAVPVATDPALPAVTQPGAGIPVTNPKPAPTAEAPEAPAAPAADVAPSTTAGEQPQAPGQPVKAQPQKSSRPAADAAEPPVAPPAPDAASALPLTAAVPAAATAPLVQSQAAPAEPSASAPAQRKIGTARAAPAVSVQQDAPAATPSADGGFARAVAGRSDADGQKGTDPGQQQQQPLVQEVAAKPAAGTQTGAHFQPATAADPARPVTAATAPSPAAPAGEPVVTARPGQLGHSMGVEIARKIESGEETLRVRLNPAELGRVEVTLGFDDRGSLQATMRAESTQALDLLRQDVPDLARTLDQAGVRTDAQSFRFENRAGDGGGNQSSPQQQQRGNQQHAQQGDFETDDQPYRAIRGDGQVDLLA